MSENLYVIPNVGTPPSEAIATVNEIKVKEFYTTRDEKMKALIVEVSEYLRMIENELDTGFPVAKKTRGRPRKQILFPSPDCI